MDPGQLGDEETLEGNPLAGQDPEDPISQDSSERLNHAARGEGILGGMSEEVFKTVDINGDGEISSEELAKAMMKGPVDVSLKVDEVDPAEEAANITWDWLLQLPAESTEEQAKMVDKIRNSLHAAGLFLSPIQTSANQRTVYFLIGASVRRLVVEAHAFRILVPVKDEGFFERPQGLERVPAMEPFDIRRYAGGMYIEQESGRQFNSGSRQQIIERITNNAEWMADEDSKDDDTPVEQFPRLSLMREGFILDMLPLHEQPSLEKLHLEFGHEWGFGYERTTIDHVVRYYGSYVGLYFAFLNYYVWASISPVVLGIIITVCYYIMPEHQNAFMFLYSTFMILWAAIFLKLWNRYSTTLAYEWSILELPPGARVNPTRVQFEGVKKSGFEVQDVDFIELDDFKVKYPLHGQNLNDKNSWNDCKSFVKVEEYFPASERRMRYAVTLPVVALCILSVGVTSIFLMLAKSDLKRRYTGAIIGVLIGMSTSVVICIFDVVFQQIAQVLTDFENHRLDTEYDNALSAKLFLFQYVNNYFTLFYLGFCKPFHPTIFGLEDTCDRGDDCMDELRTQYIGIMVANQIVMLGSELALPLVMGWLNSFLMRLGISKPEDDLGAAGSSADQANTHKYFKQTDEPADADGSAQADPLLHSNCYENQISQPTYNSTRDDFNQLAIQFGFIVQFAVVWPLGTLVAFIVNLIQCRTDAAKIMNLFRRPHYRNTNSIGHWFAVFTLMGFMAVFTNLGLLFFTADGYVAWGVHSDRKQWMVTCVFGLFFFGAQYAVYNLAHDRTDRVRILLSLDSYEADLKGRLESHAKEISEDPIGSP